MFKGYLNAGYPRTFIYSIFNAVDDIFALDYKVQSWITIWDRFLITKYDKNFKNYITKYD